MADFKQRLTELRKLNNLTQREMAKLLGIAQPSYIRYEKGDAEPKIAKLILIANIFDVTVDYLVGNTDY